MCISELIENMNKFIACAAARDVINYRCFRGGDDGHREAADNAQKGAERCWRLSGGVRF
jgi:hypothetical protein